MYFLLRWYLNAMVKQGNLSIIGVDGVSHNYGDGSGPQVRVRLTQSSLYWKLALHPDLYSGEAFMDGSLVMESGSIYDMLNLMGSQLDSGKNKKWTLIDRTRTLARRMARMNPIGRAKKNVAHHYDLSGEIYGLFLDRDLQYSCAFFEYPDQSLEDAQLAKKRHIAAKLDLRPGMKVLDIGSGWGGLALYLAEIYDVSVVGVTLSEEQHKLSSQRVKNRGFEEKIDIRLLDYRLLDEKFDRIVSVGMFEHLGIKHHGEYFKKVRELLNDDGVGVIHTIARPFGPSATSAWIKKYIFPGGYIPALSEIQTILEDERLYLCDVEVLRLHYAQTLHEWRKRFVAHWDEASTIYDEKFCRMWEFYLAGSEMAFRHHALSVLQIQITKNQNALPITRDYMGEEEARLRRFDKKARKFRSVSSR